MKAFNEVPLTESGESLINLGLYTATNDIYYCMEGALSTRRSINKKNIFNLKRNI